ncbi:MAG: hypothetical protein KCHDKBKB_02826 [Elusimicrobia bacterium]|nr:hypothetical protein [Elusimicrobiota bacterium]
MADIRSIFSDRASLILRQMIAHPDQEWVVRDFVSELGVGRGWVADVLATLRKHSYIKGEARGRSATATLRNVDELIQEWTRHYDFRQNKFRVYYATNEDVLPKLKAFFHKKNAEDAYALTLHSGANLMTHYVRDPNVYFYLDSKQFPKLLLDLRLALDLKELKQGGNVYIFEPYYKHSAFFGRRRIEGYSVVSNLQLYLDLYHFPQRGQEQVEYLIRYLKEKGENLA